MKVRVMVEGEEQKKSRKRRGEGWSASGHNKLALAVRGNIKTMHCYYAETNHIEE